MIDFRRVKKIIYQLYFISKIAMGGTGWKIGIGLFGIIFGASLIGIYISTERIDWYKDFYDALQQRDIDKTLTQVGRFFFLTFIGVSFYLIGKYIRKVLAIRWRRQLNDVLLRKWLADKAYWRLRAAYHQTIIDNPDQRIAEDCRLFVNSLLDHSLDFVITLIGFVTYLSILWSLADYSLDFSIGAWQISIPYYLVWVAFLYVFISSYLTQKLGAPLKNLLFEQQKTEADYRFALTRVRDATGQIALLKGEKAELNILDDKFEHILKNWRHVIRREFILGCFRRPYYQTVLHVPIIFALPIYLAGMISFGGLMQIKSSFSQVVNSLSWFIFEYPKLSDWVATSDRLMLFLDAIEQVQKTQSQIEYGINDQQYLEISNLVLETGDGHALYFPKAIKIQKGEYIWLRGASGIGKSSLIKAIAGFWDKGQGHIRTPADWHPYFTPQSAYVSQTNFINNITYPQEACLLDSQEIFDKIHQTGLGFLAPNLQQPDHWDGHNLSGGEQQRLMFLRILLAQPDWIFLDETISALDPAAEQHLLESLKIYLPQATVILVSHKKPNIDLGWRNINLDTHSFYISRDR